MPSAILVSEDRDRIPRARFKTSYISGLWV